MPLRYLLILLAALGGALPAFAQQDGAAQPPPAQEELPDPEAIERRIEALQQDTSVRDAEREVAIAELREAKSKLLAARAERDAAQTFVDEARSAPLRLAEYDARLRTPPVIPRISPFADIEDLRSDLAAAELRLGLEAKERENVETDEASRRRRRDVIPQRRAELEEQLENIRATIRAGTDPDVAPVVAEARRMRLLAQEAAAREELNRLDQELRSYDARKPLLAARTTLAERNLAVTRKTIANLQEAITRKRAAEAEAALREAEAELADAASAHPLIREIFENNVELSTRLAEVADHLIDLAAEEDNLSALIAQVRTRFADSRSRIERLGRLTEAIGLHLRNQRSRLPDLLSYQRRRAEVQEQMNLAQRAVSEAEFRLEQLDQPDAVIAERIEDYQQIEDTLAPEEAAEIAADMDDALASQQEDLRDLIDAYNDYLEALLEVDTAAANLLDIVRSYRTFIDERILWIQSAEPLAARHFASAWDAALWLVDPHLWWRIAGLLGSDMQDEPIVYGAWALLIVLLIAAYPTMRRRLEEIAKKTSRSSTDRYGLTLIAAGITLLMSGVAPLALAVLGWRLYAAAGDNDLAAAVSIGFQRGAVLLLATELLRNLCRPNGLAEAHFEWRTPNLRLVRRHLRWLVPVILPVVFIVAVTDVNEDYRDSLGRIAFIGGMIALSLFIVRVCHPTHGVLRGIISRYRGGWIDNLKYIWFSAFALVPIALAITASLGWFYTAVQLERRSVQTVYLILLVIVAQAFLLRWLYLAQRKLAIDQARKKLEAARAEAAEKAAQSQVDSADTPPQPLAHAPEGQSVPESVDIDVAAVSAQTQKLLNTMVAFAIAIGVVLVWVDVMPAFSMFREVELWRDTESVAVVSNPLGIPTGESAPAGEQAAPAAPAAVVESSAITLADLVFAMVIFIITVVVSKNIPGVLEIIILQRLPISPGGRYAFTTIARYAIVIVGVVLAFNAIGIGWSKVQWLAAAITVGLGFGLQEIFANFVSGLIILFERPIRVGDTVTVSGVNGTVSRIRMRATTVVDLDRKELIIPNREFVTGQVINWTLTDSVLRVIVPVGVAYGSDVELARRTLLQVAKAHPHVLEQPPPRALFLGFGASSLDFELRVFVPHIDYFITVRDELHTAVDQAFRRAGIEIAFPQQDIHIRTVKAEFPLRQLESPPEPS